MQPHNEGKEEHMLKLKPDRKSVVSRVFAGANRALL